MWFKIPLLTYFLVKQDICQEKTVERDLFVRDWVDHEQLA